MDTDFMNAGQDEALRVFRGQAPARASTGSSTVDVVCAVKRGATAAIPGSARNSGQWNRQE